MCNMLRRNLKGMRYRILCITDDAQGVTECETYPLWNDGSDLLNASGEHLPSCYRRLRLYDRATQMDMGISKGDRIVSMDLDALITGELKALLQTEGRFVGWQLKGAHHPKVFNGSFQMFDAGDLQEIWSEFDPMMSPYRAQRALFMGSDQAWLSMNLVGKPGSVGIGWPMIASYPQNVRLQATHARDTRIIFFHGRTKPWHPAAFTETGLPKQYWR
jgi:hypothetical protein